MGIPEANTTNCRAYDESVYGRAEPLQTCIGCGTSDDDLYYRKVYETNSGIKDYVCPDCGEDFDRLVTVLDGFWTERGTCGEFTSEELASYLMRHAVVPA